MPTKLVSHTTNLRGKREKDAYIRVIKELGFKIDRRLSRPNGKKGYAWVTYTKEGHTIKVIWSAKASKERRLYWSQYS
mgnify:CR=1 FL=1